MYDPTNSGFYSPTNSGPYDPTPSQPSSWQPYSGDDSSSPSGSSGGIDPVFVGLALAASQNRSGGCFSAKTKVQTPDGERTIDAIKKDDLVFTFNAATQEVTAQPVTKVVTHETARLCELSYEGKESPVLVTPNHPLLTETGWKRAGKLEVGKDRLQVLSDGNAAYALVTGLQSGAEEPVYNLHTRGNHNFIADGLVANDFIHLRRCQTLANQVVEQVQDGLANIRKIAILHRNPAPMPG